MAAAAASAAAAVVSLRSSYNRSSGSNSSHENNFTYSYITPIHLLSSVSRVHSRVDWNNFIQYLRKQHPTIIPSQCDRTHILGYFQYIDNNGIFNCHSRDCSFIGQPLFHTSECLCLIRYWDDIEALIRRLGVAFKETFGDDEWNPFKDLDLVSELKKFQFRVNYVKDPRMFNVLGHVSPPSTSPPRPRGGYRAWNCFSFRSSKG
ncbi:protein LIGHT-DEPENDENT SHORT HYPOCOTYLS 2-like [Impatiens glandulifera]|uniref:protein LIGHT-DEPENDENT SHORT HYPOCOTYLS 2-like n=1 Tax=Impatiens glandulifera TaxID=253017 RepID=UPI001FB05ACF|nr:protein LIGHT-DEPENDENT SHORT HYPOCOTYLS 2-like [Impatiens glandulifera]